jgi:hypothetical protein
MSRIAVWKMLAWGDNRNTDGVLYQTIINQSHCEHELRQLGRFDFRCIRCGYAERRGDFPIYMTAREARLEQARRKRGKRRQRRSIEHDH